MHVLNRMITAGGLALSLVGVATAQEYLVFVDDSATGANTGFNWFDAHPTLEEGLEHLANYGLPVSRACLMVAEGKYELDSNHPLAQGWTADGSTPDPEDTTFLIRPPGSLTLNGKVELHGGFLGNNTNHDCDAPDGAFHKTVLTGKDFYHHVLVIDNIANDFPTSQVIIDGFKIKNGKADGAPPLEGIAGRASSSSSGATSRFKTA